MTDPVKDKKDDLDENAALDTVKTHYSGAAAMAGIMNMMASMKHSDQIEFFKKSLEKYTGAVDHQDQNLASIKSTAKIKMPMPKLKEDMDIIFEGTELTEDFKEKMTTLLEAAVASRVEILTVRLNEEFEAEMEKSYAEIETTLAERVDEYLSEAVANWIEENKIALETGIKYKQLDAFVEKMKSAFAECYVEIPEEKVDVVKDLEEKVADLTAKLNEATLAKTDLEKDINEQKRSDIRKEVAEGLTDTQAEKFAQLIEAFATDDLDVYKKKIALVRESYFKAPTTPKDKVIPGVDLLNEDNENNAPIVDKNDPMYRYIKHIDSIVK